MSDINLHSYCLYRVILLGSGSCSKNGTFATRIDLVEVQMLLLLKA